MPKVSVIVPTYQPGDAVMRLVNSLDAQTLPQDEFEVIFVDDGSRDGTWARLQRIAATRRNVRTFRIANSGWPSRPRNVGVEKATGEYVMFMDHDDSLYPDGLRRAYEYAKENDADVLNAPEFKSDNVWWAPAGLKGNIPNALTDGGIQQLMPFMPHKLYRRQLLLAHNIRFPERPRALWEDWYINVAAYRHSKVVSVLVDTPFYLRHIHGTNTSHTFDPSRADYWERLEDVLQFVTETLEGPEHRVDRAVALARHVQSRILDPLSRLLATASPNTADLAFRRAQRLLARYTSDEVFRRLPKTHKAQAYLLRAGQPDLLVAFHAADQLQRSRTDVRKIGWRDGVLVADLECVWEPKSAKPILGRAGDRVMRVVAPEVERALPPELLDVTFDPERARPNVRIRSRREYVSWDLPFTPQEAVFKEDEAGTLRLVVRGEVALDIEAGAYGAAIAEDVWDFRVRLPWLGMARNSTPQYRGPARPMVRNGRAAVAYANLSKGLSLDLAQRLRTLAIDAEPRSGPAGSIDAFSAPLENIAVVGEGTLDASMIVAIPAGEVPEDLAAEQADGLLEKLAANGALGARVVAGADGARLEGSASLAPGPYTIFVRREGKLHRTKRSLVVDQDGQVSFA